MASIAELNIAPSEPVNLDSYKLGGAGRKFPGKGRYQLRAVESFTAESFGSNRDKTALTVQIDPTIVGPTNEGYQLRFTRVSGKTYKRGNDTVSQLGDYLKACGFTGTVPGDPQAQADLVEQTAGRVFEADLDWRAWDKSTGQTIKGMQNFPKNEDGSHVPYVVSETDVDEDGNPRKIWANLEIVRFIAS